MIESQKVKALGQNKYLAHPVTAATCEGRIVAAGAGVRIGSRNAVEVPWKEQRRGRIGERAPGSFGERTPLPFLRSRPMLPRRTR